MNTWRDIKADPPALTEPANPVFVTNGKDVYFGRLMYRTDEELWFWGCDLNQGRQTGFPASEMTEWQPAPSTFGTDINVPTKTADEMFREMGYSKAFENVYRRPVPSGHYEINCRSSEFEKTHSGQFGTMHYSLNKKEILACAQLIKEMEADNG